MHADMRYYLCMEPVDMRKQFQGLQGIVNVSKAESSGNLFTLPRPGNVTESNSEFGRYLTQDEAFIFIGKSRTMAKILHREGNPVRGTEHLERRNIAVKNGVTMYVRRLSRGRFRIPEMEAGGRTCTVSYAEFIRLVLGENCEISGHFSEAEAPSGKPSQPAFSGGSCARV